MTQAGYETIQDGPAVAQGSSWCIGIGCKAQWHVVEYRDTWWYAMAYVATHWDLEALSPRVLMDKALYGDKALSLMH